MTPAEVLSGARSWALLHGDCLDPISGLAALGDKSVDHVITDPPFDRKVHARGGHTRRYDGGPQIAALPFAALDDVGPVACEIARVIRRWVLAFCAVRQIESWSVAFEANTLRVPRVMAWVKPDASPQFSGDRPGHGWESIVVAHPVARTRWNGGGKKGVYTCNRIDHESGFHHPTQKPVDLMESLIRDFTDPGDVVVDPFAGSGTTGVACIRLGRRFIGWERDAQFYEAALKRLEQTREQPELLALEAFKRAAKGKRKQAALALPEPDDDLPKEVA